MEPKRVPSNSMEIAKWLGQLGPARLGGVGPAIRYLTSKRVGSGPDSYVLCQQIRVEPILTKFLTAYDTA